MVGKWIGKKMESRRTLSLLGPLRIDGWNDNRTEKLESENQQVIWGNGIGLKRKDRWNGELLGLGFSIRTEDPSSQGVESCGDGWNLTNLLVSVDCCYHLSTISALAPLGSNWHLIFSWWALQKKEKSCFLPYSIGLIARPSNSSLSLSLSSSFSLRMDRRQFQEWFGFLREIRLLRYWAPHLPRRCILWSKGFFQVQVSWPSTPRLSFNQISYRVEICEPFWDGRSFFDWERSWKW